MQRIKFYVGLLLGIALTLFALQNLQSTEVRLLLWQLQMPLVVLVLCCVVTGALWAALWIGVVRRRADREKPAPQPDRFHSG